MDWVIIKPVKHYHDSFNTAINRRRYYLEDRISEKTSNNNKIIKYGVIVR